MSPTTSTPPDVVVAGGGFAGLAAATALAEAGARVVLLEARPYLGGRARSWVDAATGAVVDNGQHLFMGCYDETLRLLERLGTRDLLAMQPRLAVPMVSGGGQVHWLRYRAAPPPLDAALGLLLHPGLGVRERLALLRVARAVRHPAPGAGGPTDPLDRVSVASWLSDLGQTSGARRMLWDPLAMAVLNERPEEAAASALAVVLRQLMLGGPARSALGVSRVGLSELCANPAARFLRQHGAEVRLRAPVQQLIVERNRCAGVLLDGGERIPSGAVIVALPPRELLEILPSETAALPFFASGARLAEQAIVSVYLWFGTSLTELGFAGLLDGPWHWLFNRATFAGDTGDGGHHVTLVRSAASAIMDEPKESLVRSALEHLRSCFPEARRLQIRQSLVIKEKRATVSLAPGSALQRPAFRSPLDGLYLAGDWTATGLPATLESAALSGHACARLASSGSR